MFQLRMQGTMCHALIALDIMKKDNSGGIVSIAVCGGPMREEQEQKVVGRGSLLLPVPQHVPNQTCQILQHMRKDEVYRVAVNDPLIMQFAHKLTMKHYADRDRHEHIRCKIREVGRLMLHLRKDHGITSLADALDPTQFQKVVSCVRKVAGFNDETTLLLFRPLR